MFCIKTNMLINMSFASIKIEPEEFDQQKHDAVPYYPAEGHDAMYKDQISIKVEINDVELTETETNNSCRITSENDELLQTTCISMLSANETYDVNSTQQDVRQTSANESNDTTPATVVKNEDENDVLDHNEIILVHNGDHDDPESIRNSLVKKMLDCKEIEYSNEIVSNLKTSITNSQKCRFCHQEFKYSCFLKRHEERHHKSLLTNNEATKPTKDYSHSHQCSFCGKHFTRFGLMKIHERIHTGERPYQCKLCNKTFTEKGQLNVHVKRHQNKVHSCTYCEKSFICLSHLKSHEEGHITQARFS